MLNLSVQILPNSNCSIPNTCIHLVILSYISMHIIRYIFKTITSFVNKHLHDFLSFEPLALLRSLGARVLGVVAVRTHASRISSSPVSYISESVVIHPRDDDSDVDIDKLFLLLSASLHNSTY